MRLHSDFSDLKVAILEIAGNAESSMPMVFRIDSAATRMSYRIREIYTVCEAVDEFCPVGRYGMSFDAYHYLSAALNGDYQPALRYRSGESIDYDVDGPILQAEPFLGGPDEHHLVFIKPEDGDDRADEDETECGADQSDPEDGPRDVRR